MEYFRLIFLSSGKSGSSDYHVMQIASKKHTERWIKCAFYRFLFLCFRIAENWPAAMPAATSNPAANSRSFNALPPRRSNRIPQNSWPQKDRSVSRYAGILGTVILQSATVAIPSTPPSHGHSVNCPGAAISGAGSTNNSRLCSAQSRIYHFRPEKNSGRLICFYEKIVYYGNARGNMLK